MKIAILTTFTKFFPGYSLTGIVKDKATMLAKYGHEVHLFVNERYNGESFSDDVILEKKIPFAHLKDYKAISEVSAEHKLVVNNMKMMLLKECAAFDIIMTEDFIFQGWNLPYALGIIEATPQMEKPRWMHWVHSVPTGGRDYWDIKLYGNKHKVIYPNQTDKILVYEMFKGNINSIRIIPHIKDVRTWDDFHPEANNIIDWAPQLMTADIVQVYPCSVDRLEHKGLSEVIKIFSYLKKATRTVCLFVATQWATGQKQWDAVDEYRKLAGEYGLIPGKDIIFSSDYKPTAARGKPLYGVAIPREVLKDLMKLSNLFVFPTQEETFGLVWPEICLSGSPLLVLNKSLNMMAEVSGMNALFFDFGSFHNKVNRPLEEQDRWLAAVTYAILGTMSLDHSIRSRTWVRQKYNYDYLYQHYYGPIMAESKSWI